MDGWIWEKPCLSFTSSVVTYGGSLSLSLLCVVCFLSTTSKKEGEEFANSSPPFPFYTLALLVHVFAFMACLDCCHHHYSRTLI